MSLIINAEWTVHRSEAPSILRPCGRCKCTRPFESTGKFRVNANGNRLDAWLIYSCTSCNKSWNRTVFERKPVGRVRQADFAAMQSNDPEYAERIARLPKSGEGGLGPQKAGFSLTKRCGGLARDMRCAALLRILNPKREPVRLDRVLAHGLSVGRKDVAMLVDAGVLHIQNAPAKPLRRPVLHEMTLEFHAGQDADLAPIVARLLD
ncbi:DUF1062 domain-containing protein [Labrenzia sp. VG12]|uniref:DUF1062 domain-containing protein n=1 Tax=Labrenzia sp. VG12 TaxID=2021862 RepID=UPI000B8C12EE|nr:DUF1062 domain-containing protein [Labrenzia sp. VG12]ASP33803.1 hypothetical protein CHH27_11570 [Labrenzia sp. VG12]